jgi:hypothetical protein
VTALLLPQHEAAKRLGVGVQTLREIIAAGDGAEPGSAR